jgi:hypothetical protein
MWRIYEKAGEDGWAVLVPVYNSWVFARMGNKPGWLGLVMLACWFARVGGVPKVQAGAALAHFAIYTVICFGIARAFGRGVFFGLGLTFLPFIFVPILAFTAE